MRKSHFNDEFLVLLGPIISSFFACSNKEKNKPKQQRVRALALSLWLEPSTAGWRDKRSTTTLPPVATSYLKNKIKLGFVSYVIELPNDPFHGFDHFRRTCKLPLDL